MDVSSPDASSIRRGLGRRQLLSALAVAPVWAAAETARAAEAERAGPRVVLLPSPGGPHVALRIFIAGGAGDDPPGMEGLAALTATLLARGATRSRSRVATLEALYPMAAHIGCYGDKEGFVLGGTVHRSHLEAYAGLLADQVLEPAFLAEDLRRARQAALDDLVDGPWADAESLGKQVLAACLYAGHPYAHPTGGTAAGLARIGLADVRRHHRRALCRDRITLGIAGAYPDEFPRRFAARFQSLPARGPRRPALPDPPARPGITVALVPRRRAPTAISAGHPLAIDRRHPDFYPLFVAASYLGEHRSFSGLLMRELRGKRGLSYGAYAYVESFIQEGDSTFPLPNVPRRQQHFEIWIRPVDPANAVFALKYVVFALDRLVCDGIPEEGFLATRAFLLKYRHLWTQNLSRRLGYAMDQAFYGQAIQHQLGVRLATMTRQEVNTAVRRHLRPRELAVAIVTDRAGRLRRALLSPQPCSVSYGAGTAPGQPSMEDAEVGRLSLGLDSTRVRVVQPSRLFDAPAPRA
jgi:zinc protease